MGRGGKEGSGVKVRRWLDHEKHKQLLPNRRHGEGKELKTGGSLGLKLKEGVALGREDRTANIS